MPTTADTPKAASPLADILRGSFGGPFKIVGILIGAVSLFNLSLAAFRLPLAQFLSVWVAAYRYIFHSIAEVILFWWPWPVPPAAKDGLVLWVLMGTTLMRWMISVGLHAKPHTDTLLWRLYTCFYYVYFVLLSCLLGPVLLLIYFAARDPVATFFRLYGNIPKRVYFPAIRLLQGLEEPKFDKRRNAWVLLMMFLATIAACLVLIALNAFFGHPGTIPTG